MNFEADFNDSDLCKGLIARIEELMLIIDTPIRFMEVCGTHTVALFQTGLRGLLPKNLLHISGPGCPVCVTDESEVQAFLDLAENKNIIIATFGDLIRVPNAKGNSLRTAQSKGSRVEIVYSPLDALTLAENNKDKEVVFLGIGFETTAPLIAAVLQSAKEQKIKNFSVLSCHKRVAPALSLLLEENLSQDDFVKPIDIFILPGHVATITGVHYFDFIAEKYAKPAVITGFEPLDIAHALILALEQIIAKKPQTVNAYKRAVDVNGNTKALELLSSVFDVTDAYWRGLGLIKESGLTIKNDYKEFDACHRFNIVFNRDKAHSACQCGSVLKGYIQPQECKLFGKACTPQQPLGPCMVSAEGSCAAYFRYTF